MCNPLGSAANHIVQWSAIERCRDDYEMPSGSKHRTYMGVDVGGSVLHVSIRERLDEGGQQSRALFAGTVNSKTAMPNRAATSRTGDASPAPTITALAHRSVR